MADVLKGDDAEKKSRNPIKKAIDILHKLKEEANADGEGNVPDRIQMVLVPFCLVAVGASWLHFHEGWSWMTCFYVITQIVTTVGYGDYTFSTHESKIFMSFFIVASLVVLSYVIGTACEAMMDGQKESLKNHLQATQGTTPASEPATSSDEHRTSRTSNLSCVLEKENVQDSYNQLASAIFPALLLLAFGTFFFHFVENCSCGFDQELIAHCNPKNFETCSATGGTVKDFVDCFYFCVIAVSTVGFGDTGPTSRIGRMVWIPWMLISVPVWGHAIAQISSFFYESKLSDRMMAKEAAEHISEETFKAIDVDGSGKLDKWEFVSYSLLKYGMVTEELLAEIGESYDCFDGAATGQVTFAAITKRKTETGEPMSPESEVPLADGPSELP